MATTFTTKELEKGSFDVLKGAFGYTNKLQAPRCIKVVVSTGVGKVKDKKKIEIIENRLAKITGQKAAPRGAKKSIASFKVRQGDIIGFVTLDNLLHLVIGVIKDEFHKTRDIKFLMRILCFRINPVLFFS